jgi:ribosomal protein S27E
MRKSFKTGIIQRVTPVKQRPMSKRKELKCSECGGAALNVFAHPDRIMIDCNDCGTLWQILWDKHSRVKKASANKV